MTTITTDKPTYQPPLDLDGEAAGRLGQRIVGLILELTPLLGADEAVRDEYLSRELGRFGLTWDKLVQIAGGGDQATDVMFGMMFAELLITTSQED
jgi:hypothetical protein